MRVHSAHASALRAPLREGGLPAGARSRLQPAADVSEKDIRRLRQAMILSGLTTVMRDRGRSVQDIADATGIVSAHEIAALFDARARGIHGPLLDDEQLNALGVQADMPATPGGPVS